MKDNNNQSTKGKIYVVRLHTLIGLKLKTQKDTHERRKTLTLILLPALALIWLVGWSLYWIGFQRKTTEKEQASNENNVTMMIIPKEKIEVRN